jgi:hypothetical protein
LKCFKTKTTELGNASRFERQEDYLEKKKKRLGD